MADDKTHQDDLSEEERSRTGRMGDQASHSGQKGGKAQSGYTGDNTTDDTRPLSDMTKKDRDLS